MSFTDSSTTHRAPSTTHQAPRASDRAETADGAVFNEILCAVDGTRSSNAAVRLASRLAADGAQLTLLAVTGEAGYGRYATAAISPARAKIVLERARRIARRAGVHPVTAVDHRRPILDVILEHAGAADLLVLGQPPTSRLAKLIVDSVTTQALSRFTTPLLVAREAASSQLAGRSMIVASDGLDGSERVIELAGRLAASQHAPLTLVHASGVESRVAGRSIQAQAERLAAMLPPEACKTRIEPGAAAEVILDAAKATGATMIVAGSRRLGGVRAFGSVSRRLVHAAPCSVLLVPPEDAPAAA